MKIGFFAGRLIPIHAATLEERPLGGTETALIRVAEQLAQRNHDVTVFTSHLTPPASVPRYLHASQLLTQGEFDLLIYVQDWQALFLGARSKYSLFWTGDGPEQFSTLGLGDKRVWSKLDRVLAVSFSHGRALCETSGLPQERCFVVGNGIVPEYFSGIEERRRKRLIFTSAPYRGLDLTVPIVSTLVAKHPELEFSIFSGMSLYDREKPFSGPLKTEEERLRVELSKLPCVSFHEPVKQAELAREYMKSSVMVYPCTVPETCCITVLEAQAAGCVPIVSTAGALPESVGSSGLVVHGQPGSDKFNAAFVDGIDKLLTDDVLWGRLSLNGLAKAQNDLTWAHVTNRFEAIVGSMIRADQQEPQPLAAGA